MIQIAKLESVDEDKFDHVKCPQCRTRLCGKQKGARIHLLQLDQAGRLRQSPLLFTCKRCGNHYLIATAEE